MSTRSEEHTSELQSLTDISYAVFCLKKKKKIICINKMTEYGRKIRVSDILSCRYFMYIYLSFHFLYCYKNFSFFFFFNDTATTEIYTSVNTLSLHDALPI